MKKFVTMAAVVVASLAMLASCDKDGADGKGNTPAGEATRTVVLKMIYPEDTRAAGDPVTAADYIDFTSGHIFFINGATGNIDLHVGIGNTAGDPNVPYADVTGTEEVVIGGIPVTATVACLIGNDVGSKYYSASGITTNLTGTNINDLIFDYDLSVINVNSADGGVGNVTVFSNAALLFTSGTTPVDGTPYDATVTLPLSASAARLEVARISADPVTVKEDVAGTPADVTYTVTDFTVEGIYINNYYPVTSPFFPRLATMTPAPTTPDVVWNNGNDPAEYATTGTTQYATGGNAVGLADHIDRPATGAAITPGAGKVWAYNVLSGSSIAEIPHIVVKLSSVTYTSSANPGNPVTLTDQWVTVTGFSEGGVPLTHIDGGHVYSMSDLSFDYTNIAPVPEYEAGYAVRVIVEVRPWTVTNVNPEY